MNTSHVPCHVIFFIVATDAMVRLKSSHFLAQESRGREEVCVILLDQKSVAFPFEVHFIFTEGTARMFLYYYSDAK